MHKIKSRYPHQDSIKIEWNLGKRCNYDCTYCPSEIHDHSSPHTDVEILKSTIDYISQAGNVRLSFTGGEPCVHPNISEVIDYAKHKGIGWISVTTNGTRKAEWYVEQKVDHYVFSLHFEHDWNKVLNTINAVSKSSAIPIMVNIMVHHEHVEPAKFAANKLKLANIPYVLRRIRWTQGDHDLFDDMKYNPDDLNWLLTHRSTVQANCVIDDVDIVHANDVIKHKLNNFQGWTCYAGIESLMINWDGEVHRATCRVGGSLGNIYQGTFTRPYESIICTRNWCTCAADIPITKHT